MKREELERTGSERDRIEKGGTGMGRIRKETELKKVELEWTGSGKKLN